MSADEVCLREEQYDEKSVIEGEEGRVLRLVG
jgi:hypothetical protein